MTRGERPAREVEALRARGGRICAGVALLLPITACAATEDDQTLTVFAAASLTAVFDELAVDYEDEHPGVDVRLSYGGSSDLAGQLREGAEADVFASADTRTMDLLVADGLVAGRPEEFATNTLTIAVPPGNPADIRDAGDLGRADVDLVLCAPQVPCGAAAVELAEALGTRFDPVSEEQSVTDVLAKVRAGEADAGLVYVTDVQGAAGEVEGVPVREAEAIVNHYPVAVLDGTDQQDLAQGFVDLVLSGRGRAALAEAGFGAPRP